MIIDNLLAKKPYDYGVKEKELLFLDAMKESFQWHQDNNALFQRFLKSHNFKKDNIAKIEELPFLPITIFKEMELITGRKEEIKSVVKSSATTSNKPSVIYLDEITMKRQQTALKNIMNDFLGMERKVFLIFDCVSTAQKKDLNMSSRASAIRGFVQFSKRLNFFLNENLEPDLKLLEAAVKNITKNDEICFFGFTWLVYKTLLSIKNQPEIEQQWYSILQNLSEKKKIIHIGGWKKLTDMEITKERFNHEISRFFEISEGDIIDFYGMTEQLGTVYPDCERGFKHTSLYSDIIIRDSGTFKSLPNKQIGLMQLLTPLPNSYPGISILTEDLGQIMGVDDCLCGRKGKYFRFEKRIETAPLKGCGDTL